MAEAGRLAHEPLLGPATDLAADVGRQVVEGPHYDRRLVGGDGALTQGAPHPVPAPVERPGQPQLPAGGCTIEPRVVGQPGCRVTGSFVGGEVVGAGEHAQPELLQLGTQRAHPSSAAFLSSALMNVGSMSATSFRAVEYMFESMSRVRTGVASTGAPPDMRTCAA